MFLKILRKINIPIAAPSANISTKVSPTEASHVFEEFKNKISLILDGGPSKLGIESTVIDLTKKTKILREGFVTKEKLNKVLSLQIKNSIVLNLSPGQAFRHYNPGIPVFLNSKKPKKKGALLVFGKSNFKGKMYFI